MNFIKAGLALSMVSAVDISAEAEHKHRHQSSKDLVKLMAPDTKSLNTTTWTQPLPVVSKPVAKVEKNLVPKVRDFPVEL